MQQQPIQFKQTRDFGQVINDTFTFTKQQFKPLVRTYVMNCGIFVLAGMIAMVMQQVKSVDYFNGTLQNQRPAGPFDGFSVLGWEYFVSIFISLINHTVMTISIFSFVAEYVENGNSIPASEQIWERIKSTFLSVFGSIILWSFLIGAGILLCVLPGIYLLPICYLFTAAMVIERASFGQAWETAFRLIKDNWWATFGVMIVMFIIVYTSMSILTLPTTIFGMLGVFTEGKPEMSLPFAIAGTVIQALCQIFLILPLVAMSFCYYSLLEQKDGVSLMDRISSFSTGDQNPGHERPETY